MKKKIGNNWQCNRHHWVDMTERIEGYPTLLKCGCVAEFQAHPGMHKLVYCHGNQQAHNKYNDISERSSGLHLLSIAKPRLFRSRFLAYFDLGLVGY